MGCAEGDGHLSRRYVPKGTVKPFVPRWILRSSGFLPARKVVTVFLAYEVVRASRRGSTLQPESCATRRPGAFGGAAVRE
jgi:hypothetical protein